MHADEILREQARVIYPRLDLNLDLFGSQQINLPNSLSLDYFINSFLEESSEVET